MNNSKAGANAIVLEYVPESLEVCFMLGDTGAGRILEYSEPYPCRREPQTDTDRHRF